MRRSLVLTLLLSAVAAHGQQKASPGLKAEKSIAIIDTGIASMAREISSDSIKSYIATLVSFKTRHSMSDTTGVVGIGAARRWVAGKFLEFRQRNKARMTVEMDPFELTASPEHPRITRSVTMKNILATLPGTDAKDTRILLVSGHLDSRNSDALDSAGLAPGANDDASGVAVVLELVRVMSRKKYPCTIIFMAVQGEEQGLMGSRHMAQKLKTRGSNVVAMLNNDIVGNSLASETGDKNDKTVRVFSEMIPAVETDAQTEARKALKGENDSPSRQLARYIKETGEVYIKGFSITLNTRPDRFLRGGDHTPFSQAGFTAVRFTEFNENFAHQHQNVRVENNLQYGDLPEFVDYGYAADVARYNLIALASIAKAPAAPQEVKMKVALGNVTNLRWSAPETGPKPKGYYVLMRETYRPFWEKKFFVSGTEAALPYSKDNYFFAIQSVGVEGHVSLAVMPVPER
jgi:hypothetical protein